MSAEPETTRPSGSTATLETRALDKRGPRAVDPIVEAIRSVEYLVGVNSFLTITALAERAVGLLAADRGWTIDYGE